MIRASTHIWRLVGKGCGLAQRLPRRAGNAAEVERALDIRISGPLFDEIRAHVEDFSRGEEAGFLLCGYSRLPDRDVLLAREFMPVPAAAMERNSNGSVLAWTADFNSAVLERALATGGTLVLVHSHGAGRLMFSPDDRSKERPLFGGFSRLLEPLPTGTLLLGDRAAAGSFWRDGKNDVAFGRFVILGDAVTTLRPSNGTGASSPSRHRLVRQSCAIGPQSDRKLADAHVAIVGASGGGSHVVQQLAHQGVGTLTVIDDQRVEESQLGRMVGATEADIDRSYKTAVARRVIHGIDSSITVIEVRDRFPSAQAIDALKEADIIVACLDRFDARESVNAFARRYLIPLVDIGMTIRSFGEGLAVAHGQVAVSLPGRPCLRCWMITDPLLAREKLERPPGYDRNPDAPGDPQVVSMNGTLASEACNCVLDLITGYSCGSRGAQVWQYDGRTGEIHQSELPCRRSDCPACTEEALGDPDRAAQD